MKKPIFDKPFTQQEPIPRSAINVAVNVLKTGRLHRYNTIEGQLSETALLEKEYAVWQKSKYCLATTSGGTALQIALRAVGVKAGAKVLTNAFTLAPVPGAISAVGGMPILIETTRDLTLDFDHLLKTIKTSKAKFMLISHMRGHLSDMESLMNILSKHKICLIEDCAHTMGASWNGKKSGNFGSIACFSTQTYKHINSGEGGFITTSDKKLIASAILLSGSYMLYNKHLSAPDESEFKKLKFLMPNCSSRMDNLRASILRPQLKKIISNQKKWNVRHDYFKNKLSKIIGIYVPSRPLEESYVGSSFQFLVSENWSRNMIERFIKKVKKRGVELKWFGDLEPKGYTSRHESWKYFPSHKLKATSKVMHQLIDMRIPLTFSLKDCRIIYKIIQEEFLIECKKLS